MVSITQPIVVRASPPESQTKRAVTKAKGEQPARQNSHLFLGCLLVAGLGITAFCLLKRSKTQATSPSHIKITALISKDKSPASTEGLLHYKNRETRNIEWNNDGLPSKIVIEREYYQLP